MHACAQCEAIAWGHTQSVHLNAQCPSSANRQFTHCTDHVCLRKVSRPVTAGSGRPDACKEPAVENPDRQCCRSFSLTPGVHTSTSCGSIYALATRDARFSRSPSPQKPPVCCSLCVRFVFGVTPETTVRLCRGRRRKADWSDQSPGHLYERR